MNIAQVVASRATCDRKKVGAVIVRDKNILSTGYNGSLSGLPHCEENGHEMENDHCVRTIHAEANAIVQAARNLYHCITLLHLFQDDSKCGNSQDLFR